MDLSQHQRTHYLEGGERRQRNMKPTQSLRFNYYPVIEMLAIANRATL